MAILIELYRSLAQRSFRNNGQTYLPLVLVAVMMLSFSIILHDLAFNSTYKGVAYMTTLQMVLQMGYYVLQIFNFLFLYYAHSYLLGMRSKELTLYQVLGLDKRNLLAITTWENIYLFFFIISSRALLGSLGDYLVQGLFTQFAGIKEEIPWTTQGESYKINGPSYLVLLVILGVRTLVRILKQNPLSYLEESKRRQTSEILKGVYTLLGILCLGFGYFIALEITGPASSILFFLITVLLVILGTYYFFLGILEIILKFLQGRESFYYEKNRVTAISGLRLRLRDQAMGLGSITVLMVAVLVLLSCALSLNQSLGALVGSSVPLDLVYKASCPEKITQGDSFGNLFAPGQVALERNRDKVKEVIQLRAINGNIDLNHPEKGSSQVDWNENSTYIKILPRGKVNKLLHISYGLKGGEALVSGREPGLRGDLNLSFLGTYRQEKEINEDLRNFYDLKQADLLQKLLFLVVDESSFQGLAGQARETPLATISHIPLKNKGGAKLLKEELLKVGKDHEKGFISFINSRREVEEDGRGLYGGFTFTGLSLGIIFLVALGAAIYYKQLAEGYQDQKAFTIYRRVGMDRETIKRSIRTQVSLIFFLPVALSWIHVAFTYQLLSRMMSLLDVGNDLVYLKSTLLVLTLVFTLYCIWCEITEVVYYRLLGQKNKGLLS